MRQAPTELRRLVEPLVVGFGYELVGIEFYPRAGSGLLRIYIDSEAGVTVDDCARVSHQVSGALDVEDPIAQPYDLEVSSPGIDRPLFDKEHFARFSGQQAKIRLYAALHGRRNLSGILRGVRGESVVLEIDSDRNEPDQVRIPLQEIQKAHLVTNALPLQPVAEPIGQ